MKWVVKAAVQQILGLVPARLADPIYHGLQYQARGIPTGIQGHRDFIQEAAAVGAELRGRPLTGLRIVELGSGWYPVVPLLLIREFGAAQVLTFDISRHYSPTRIARAAREIMQTVAGLKDDPVLQQVAASGRLPENIGYYPHTRVQDLHDLNGGPADLAVSASVLEYIPPDGIREILQSSRHWLAPDALWFPLIGTSDDRAHQDSSLHPVEFLKYGEKEWSRISGNRYGYKNRLRRPQYRPLFESAGWRVEWESALMSKTAVSMLHRVSIHEDFRGFSPEELTAGCLRFALGRA